MRTFSIPDVRALLDTSPPVFYPSKRRDRSSSHSLSSNTVPDSSPNRPKLHPSPSLGNLARSVSANDVSGEWEQVRRASITERDVKGSPSRPAHRRSQSALPPGLGTHQPRHRSGPSPMGRLQEFSRNPLASASAISLPTLAELELDGPSPTTDPPIPPSPIVRSRNRRTSRISSTISLEPPSPSCRQSSSVPPPQQVHSSMPPPARPPARPPASPRAWSTHEMPLNPPKTLYTHSRRPSLGSTSSVSDVAVLATWSFPTSPEKKPSTEQGKGLRERLRSLSSLDSSDLPITITSSPVLAGGMEPDRGAGSAVGVSPRRNLPPHLAHRHSHSSPSVIHLPPPAQPPQLHLSLPGPTPPHSRPHFHRRTTTTSRLRQPNPLSMPHEPLLNTLSTSPGSLISDDSSVCPSPTNSVESLPASVVQGGSVESLPASVSAVSLEEGRGWLGRWGSRRTSLSVPVDVGQGKCGRADLERSEVVIGVERDEEDEGDEEYIDFDEM